MLTVTLKVAVCVCVEWSPVHPPTPKQTLPSLPASPLHSARTHTYTHTLSRRIHTLHMDVHTHCGGVHTHRAPPCCFPSAVSALHFMTPSHLSSPIHKKTLPARISLMTHLSSTLWLYRVSRPSLSPSLTFSHDPWPPPHVQRQRHHQLSKDGAKSKPRLRCISVIYFDYWKDWRMHQCCVHFSSTFKQWPSTMSATQSWPRGFVRCWSSAGQRERAMFKSWPSWCYAASHCFNHTLLCITYSRYGAVELVVNLLMAASYYVCVGRAIGRKGWHLDKYPAHMHTHMHTHMYTHTVTHTCVRITLYMLTKAKQSHC